MCKVVHKVVYVASRLIITVVSQPEMVHSREESMTFAVFPHSLIVLSRRRISTTAALFRICFNTTAADECRHRRLVLSSRRNGKAIASGVDSGSPRFQPVVKLGTPGMDLLWGPTRALERCDAPGWSDVRTDERTGGCERSEDTHKRYLEFLRGFSRKYFDRLCRESAFTTLYGPSRPPPPEGERSRFSRGLLMRHAIGNWRLPRLFFSLSLSSSFSFSVPPSLPLRRSPRQSPSREHVKRLYRV